ncbi:MAG: hypothetical protein AMXMBFR64_07270 [Myxococcales bacterium]
MSDDRITLTPGGVRRLQRRLADARAAYRATCDDNPAAAEAGDSSVWHDNFAYEENQRRMHWQARQVRDLEGLLGRAAVVQPVPEAPICVTVGSRVIFSTDGEPQTVWIAGWDDGDPARGRVSYNSPLGRALIGAEVGEVRELRVGSAVREIEVVHIDVTAAEDDE